MNKVIKGTSLLLLTSIIVKVLSAIYRIPFQNLVGNEGFYIYQQVYPLYGLGMTIALSGVPVYLSKYAVEYQFDLKKLREIYTLLFIIGLVCFSVLFFGAHGLAVAMGDIRLKPLIQVAALIFLLSPYLALYRGVFQAELELRPTALSQLVEQTTRVGVILIAAYVLVSLQVNLYTIGTVAMLGSVAGSALALFVLMKWGFTKQKMYFQFAKPSKETLKHFCTDGLLLICFVSFLLLFQLIDSFVIVNQLQAAQFSTSVSQNLKGIYDRGQPMIQVGLVCTTVFLQALLPLLSHAVVNKQPDVFRHYKELVYKLLWLILLPITLGLFVLMPEINWMLFDNTEGTAALRIFSLAVFFMSSLQCFQTIEQSLRKTRHLWGALLVGLVVKYIATYFFVFYYQIIGASLGTICGLVAANLWYVLWNQKELGSSNFFKWRYLIVLVSYTICLVVYQSLGMPLIHSRMSASIFAFFGIVINGIILVLIVIRGGYFTNDELASLPFGNKLKYLMRNGNENR